MSDLFTAVRALIGRPRLWPAAIGAARSLVPRQWWRRAPYLPLPDRSWLHYRLVTAYGGDGSGAITADDVVTYIEWRRHFPTAQS